MSERNLSPAVRAAVIAPTVRPALFFYASFPDVEFRIWSGLGSILWEEEVWAGAGSLVAVEDISESIDSGQKGVSVRLSGVPSEIFDAASLGDYQNRPVKIWLAVFDLEAFNMIADPYLFFSGVLDSDSVEDNGVSVIITMFAESQLSDHLRARVFRYSHEDQQTLYPAAGDRGLEFVAALQDVQLKWGSK